MCFRVRVPPVPRWWVFPVCVGSRLVFRAAAALKPGAAHRSADGRFRCRIHTCADSCHAGITHLTLTDECIQTEELRGVELPLSLSLGQVTVLHVRGSVYRHVRAAGSGRRDRVPVQSGTVTRCVCVCVTTVWFVCGCVMSVCVCNNCLMCVCFCRCVVVRCPVGITYVSVCVTQVCVENVLVLEIAPVLVARQVRSHTHTHTHTISPKGNM